MSLILLIGVYFIYSIRVVYMSFRSPQKDYRYLLLSCYVLSLTIGLGYGFYTPFSERPGSFGISFTLGSVQLIPIALLLLTKGKIRFKFALRKHWGFLVLAILFIISILNPYNITKTATLIAIYNIGSILFFAYVISKILPYEDIIKGIWDGLCIVAILQFILSIIWPVLGITSITNWLGYDVYIDAMRNRANGSFNHPNTMGAYMSYVFVFFVSCILCGYKKEHSKILCAITFCTIVLTISRSAILASIASLCFLIFISKNPSTPILSFRIFFKFILPTLLIVAAIVFFTPLKKYFVSIQAENMVSARMVHNVFYLNIVADHPYLGVGLNTGVAHFAEFYNDLVVIETEDLPFEFMMTNPVHNIYVLLLVDTGIVGLFVFLFFMGFFFKASKQALVHNKDSLPIYNILPLIAMGSIIPVIIHGFSDYTPLAPTNYSLWLFFCMIAYLTSKYTQVQRNVQNQ